MKLSLNWLNKYIDHGLSSDELSKRLTMAGLEVESIAKYGDDVVFELEITPNRPDCLNILGLAREVSAITDKDMSVNGVNEYEDVGDLEISIEDMTGCSRYIGTLIDGIQVKEIPAEYARLLQAIGLKPISNIVDITNFVMFEIGQPLHAFDFDKVEGGRIKVRRARKGEKIVTLDDVERELDPSILVIADAKKPVALAGIMGGRDTGVTTSTKRILLEAASFDLGIIRRGSRRLGLTSDSCYRFERGVAWKNVETGSNRATDLILAMAGGNLLAHKDVMAASVMNRRRAEILVSVSDIQGLLGVALELPLCEKILKRLGCIVASGAKDLTVIPPLFRNDLRIKEDIIEELARVVGYDNLPMSLPHVQAENIALEEDKSVLNKRVSDLMIAQGLHETVTYSLMSRSALDKLQYKDAVIGLQNPMSAEQEIMRPTLLANLLQVVGVNFNHGQKDIRLFEVGKRYVPGRESWTLAAIMAGRRDSDWRRSKREMVDFYDLKGVLEELLSTLRVNEYTVTPTEIVVLESGQAATVKVNGKPVGYLGKVAKPIAANFDIKRMNIFYLEVDLELLSEEVGVRQKFVPLNVFPSSVRDISLAVKETDFEAIRALCIENGKGLLEKIDFVELYTGDKIESGYKGYVLSLTYQAHDRTLTDEEVNVLHEDVVNKLISSLKVKRR